MGERARLTPTMRSRKLQALDFIKRYNAQWGVSPTLSELASELGISVKYAHELVGQLSREKQIEIVKGKKRGIVLIDRGEAISEADILLRLAQLGWQVKDGAWTLTPPLTKNGLPDVLYLDHKPDD
jgi:SOS-response transcriptional repressor LexA